MTNRFDIAITYQNNSFLHTYIVASSWAEALAYADVRAQLYRSEVDNAHVKEIKVSQ